ncbi:hypothetical protein HDC36_004201 [Xanthomonas sp. JAI131]|uniref:DUF4238 domain-containing protein n=1 Tax=Xanthomonas sp. JAI131 TaxID=2723067 RepID=UPI0015C73F65|nr:DUF4238 domain-containing protein [Xanthomonas sp. JAI131]NYF22724.1 hypothetical protein [Xanthomonas sp. JAI131]
MYEKRKHHFVPVTYLKGFTAIEGSLHVYRKADPTKPFVCKPENIGFTNYYYGFDKADGTFDTNSLEDAFQLVENDWPASLAAARNRSELLGNDLARLLEYIALQRARVPATRDSYERFQAAGILATARQLHAQGKLPPIPGGREDILDDLEITVSPQSSLRGIAVALEACEKVFNSLNFGILRNETEVPLLTSDNPVIWFDPSMEEDLIQPYRITQNGPIDLFFPMAPDLLLYGWNPRHAEEFLFDGVRHGALTDPDRIAFVNRMIVRFGYHTVFSTSASDAPQIAPYATMSPTLSTAEVPVIGGRLVVGTMTFGPMAQKTKWKPEDTS